MNKNVKNWIYVLLFVSIIGFISFFRPVVSTSNNTIDSLSNKEYIFIKDTLTEWEIFVMALVEVECERNPNAQSNKNAIGPLQITPIYVEEVNRIYNTNYKFEDAWDLNKSLEMFELTNDYYNPNRDIDKAIQIHNPGAGKWYSDRIKQRMKMVRFSEEVRIELKDNTKWKN